MAIFLPQRWKNQPQGALTIDRGHSLSTGLCSAWHPAAQQYIGPGIAPSPTGTYAYQADASGALGVKFNGAANSRIALPAGSAGFGTGYSGTRLVLFRYTTGTNGLVNGITLSTGSGNDTLGMRMNGPGQIFLVRASVEVVASATVPTSSNPTVALCTANDITQETRLHVNGQLLGNNTRAYASSNGGIWVGAITNHNSDSNFFLALSWDRALSIPEAAAIQENPWQIFKPNPGRLYFLPATTTTTQFKGGRFLPQHRKSQPQGAVQTDPRVDLVWTPSQSLGWTRGANGAITYGSNGVAWNVASASNAFLSTNKPAKSAALTLIAVVKFNSLSATTFSNSQTSSGAVIYSQRTLDGDNSPTLTVSNDTFAGGVMRVWFGRDTAGTAFGKANTLVTIQTGVWYSIAVSCDANGVTGIVVNGLSNATQVSVAGSWLSSWTGATAYVGTQRQWPLTADDDANIEVSLFARIPQNISQSELVSLSNNPWQIFKPNSGRLYFLPATTTAFKGGRFLPQRWKTQPQGNIEIDWNNFVTKGLFLATAPGISAKAFFRIPSDDPNFVSATIAPVIRYQSTTNRASITPFGIGILGNVLYNSLIYGNATYSLNTVANGGSPVYTYGAVYCQMATPDASGTSGFSYTNNQSQFSLQANDVSTFFFARNWTSEVDVTSNDHNIVIPGGVPNGKLLTATNTWATGQPGRIYNGKQLLTSSNSTVWDGGYFAYNNPYFAGYSSGKTTALLGVTWLRALTDNDRAAFDENPWQIFKPNPGRIYFLPGVTKRGKFLFLFS